MREDQGGGDSVHGWYLARDARQGEAGSGDTIDLTNVLSSSISSLKFANGALTVTTTNGTDVLHFAGSYGTSSITPLTDGSGNGTDIVFRLPAA
jgi:hypothetical protein